MIGSGVTQAIAVAGSSSGGLRLDAEHASGEIPLGSWRSPVLARQGLSDLRIQRVERRLHLIGQCLASVEEREGIGDRDVVRMDLGRARPEFETDTDLPAVLLALVRPRVLEDGA